MVEQLRMDNYFLHSDELPAATPPVIVAPPTPVCYPFVKWAGGKGQLLDKLELFIPAKFDRYFEPFLGGGALFLHLITHKKKKPINFASNISDINGELIDAYLVIKDNVSELISQLDHHKTKYKEGQKEEYYYQLRGIDPNTLNNIEIAARFITLNKTCYNGLYRVNSKGLFNVPWGKYPNPVICDRTNLTNVSTALNNSDVRIQVSDYKAVLLENAKEGDFIYLDPPYSPASPTAYFTSYTKTGFNNKDQEELATVFRELDKRGCKVLLSNSDTQFIRDLYSDYGEYLVEVNDAVRAISSNGSKRTGHKELIIRNYSMEEEAN